MSIPRNFQAVLLYTSSIRIKDQTKIISWTNAQANTCTYVLYMYYIVYNNNLNDQTQ